MKLKSLIFTLFLTIIFIDSKDITEDIIFAKKLITKKYKIKSKKYQKNKKESKIFTFIKNHKKKIIFFSMIGFGILIKKLLGKKNINPSRNRRVRTLAIQANPEEIIASFNQMIYLRQIINGNI